MTTSPIFPPADYRSSRIASQAPLANVPEPVATVACSRPHASHVNHPKFNERLLLWSTRCMSAVNCVRHGGIQSRFIPCHICTQPPFVSYHVHTQSHSCRNSFVLRHTCTRSHSYRIPLVPAPLTVIRTRICHVRHPCPPPQVKLPSTEVRLVYSAGYATIGPVGNPLHKYRQLGFGAISRYLGRRPVVRGMTMENG